MYSRNLLLLLCTLSSFISLFAQAAVERVGPGKRYEECVREVVDKLLASRVHSVSEYRFGFGGLPTGKFWGFVKIGSGSTILYIDEPTEVKGVESLVATLTLALPGFATIERRFEFEGNLKLGCTYEGVRNPAPAPAKRGTVTLPDCVSGTPSTNSGVGPYFGSVPDFNEPPRGVRLADVREGSPASKAGLKRGDILIEFDGKAICN